MYLDLTLKSTSFLFCFVLFFSGAGFQSENWWPDEEVDTGTRREGRFKIKFFRREFPQLVSRQDKSARGQSWEKNAKRSTFSIPF